MSKFLIVAVLLAAAVLQGPALSAQPRPVPPDTLIVLDRGACEQRCAVYRLAIFADGTVIYDGRYFVRRAGLVRSSISPDALSNLIADLDAGGFFAMESNYGYGNKDHCDAFESGDPAAILTVSSGGRSKTILHNHGCSGKASSRLTDLEDKVDRAVGAVKWIK